MSNIKIIAHFCGKFDETSNNRFLYVAKMLKDAGNEVEIISSNFDHFTKKYHKPQNEYYGCKLTLIDTPAYKKNISIKRLFSHYLWGIRVKKYLNSIKTPDVIYCAYPTLKAAKEAMKYCKKNNVYGMLDVQDLWPEAFEMSFNKPIIKDIIFTPFKAIGNNALKNADYITSVSNTYTERIISKYPKKASSSIYIGTDLTMFDKYVKENNKRILKDLNIEPKKKGEIWFGYCGSLTQSYDLKRIMDALSFINGKNEKAKLLVMGNGDMQGEFLRYAFKKNIDAVFTDHLPYSEMCALLTYCDFTINPIISNSPATICNKHADYAAAGKPIINIQNCTEYVRIINKYDAGINGVSASPRYLSYLIKELWRDKARYKKACNGARESAEELFNRQIIYKEIVNQINKTKGENNEREDTII